MASTIAAITTGIGGIVTTADASGILQLLAGTTTVVTVTPAGMALNAALPVTSGGTGVTTSTGAGSVVLSANPALTGVPTAPTAAIGTNTDQLATTDFATGVLSAAANGYARLASGLMIQWGYQAATGGSTAISFPTVFPTSIFTVVIQMRNSAANYQSVTVTDQSTSGCTVAGDGLLTGYNFIAIGI